MLTIVSLLAVVFFLGTEYTLLIIVGSVFIYLYPIKSIVILAVLGLLIWHGKKFKRKLKRYFKRKFDEY